ncbi:MAG: hypothetical protein EHM61_18775 [Acidobacteria bacterium]|nr:MAG: hypothetical protein EHM61_18775 [Acidobacteriota bacterium]
MTKGRTALFVIILVAVAFLSGLLIGYWEVRDARQSLEIAEQQRDSLRLQGQLSRIRDLAALMYVETSRRNYGLGSEYADRYFKEVERLGKSGVPDPIRSSMTELMGRREAVTASLARAEPGATQQVQALFLDTYHRTQLEDAGQASARPE